MNSRGFSELSLQPARHKCPASCLLWAEKTGVQPALGSIVIDMFISGTFIESGQQA